MAQPLIKKDRLPARSFIVGVSVIGLSVFVYSFYQVATAPLNAEWVLLTLVTVLLISRIDIGIPKASSTITITDTFLFISVLLYGTFPSVVLAGFDGAVVSLHFKNKRRVMPFNVAVLSLSMFVSSTVVGHAFGDLQAGKADLSLLFMAAGLLALIHYILNSGIVSAVSALRRRRSLVHTWKESFLLTSLSYFAGSIAACLIIKLIDIVSFYAFIVAVPIIAITYFSYKVYLNNLDASNRHAEQVAELHLRTIEALAIAIDAKGEVSHDHVHRVQVYSTGLARIFGLSDAEIEALKAGALLHDIGKLAVPDYILNKPGPLTTAEFDKMKVHTIVGAEILERVGFPYPVVPVVRHHHERWDGRGYPDGLKGEQIPITARILAVCDCFDAVREDRQYRKAMTREQALQILREGSGTVFDPKVISAFLEHLDEFEAEIRSMRVVPNKFEDRRAKKVAETSRLDNDHKAFERIRSANRELITLYYIAQTIGTSLDLRDTFAVFSARLEDIVSYTTCVLYLQKTDSTEVEVAHVAGRNAERFKGRRMASGAGIAGWVVANRHSMHNCDPALDFDTMKMEISETYKTATVVPLMKDDEVLGALALYSADLASYDTDHLRLMEAVAKLASDAIANALQHERTETSALTDVITGLPNARALRYRFEEEADRAKRHKDIFSVVMMDLDRFKSVNDQLGHQAGDHLLKELGRILLAQVRSSDFVCRYAGDEFVAILQVGSDEVQELLSRIQKTVDGHDFGFSSSNVFIGLSLGAASFGADGDTLDELLLAADRSMYADKARRKSVMNEAGTFKTSDLSQYRVM
jgi:diguanylate cyclase (GGDEF)-like protein/putative nucleotidyltransferase with HDIG domain